jgi:hypothetical protein
VAVDSTDVYWVDDINGTVNKVPIGGGTVTTLAGGPGGEPWSVAVDGTHVYWVNCGCHIDEPNAPGTVNEVPLGGGSKTTLAGDEGEPDSVAIGP